MKTNKRRSVLCLFLVLLQVFFVFSVTAIAAEETSSEGVTLSLTETTLEQDLTAEVVAEKDALYIETMQRALSLVGFAAEMDGRNVDLFFYLFSPNGFADVENIMVTITEELDDGKELSSPAYCTFMDRSLTLAKVKLDGMMTYRCGYSDNKLYMRVDNFSLTYTNGKTITNASFYDDIGNGVEVNGSYSLVYDLTQGIITSNTRSDILELDVRLAAERVSTPDANTYTQINTAMMLIPNKYYNAYGDLDWVEYIYSLYEKVPMLITSDKTLYSSIVEGKRFPLGYYVYPIPTQLNNRVFHAFSLDYKSYNSYFAFLVDSIADSETDIERDVGESEILKRFYLAKDYYNANVLKDYIYASNIVLNEVKRTTKEDFIKTVSYEDAATFFNKLFDGRLFVKNIDDSVNLPAIQAVDLADLSLSDTDLAAKYCIDEYYVDSLRDMAKKVSTTEDGFQLLLMRYLLTDYVAESFSAFYNGEADLFGMIDGISDAEGYLCYNAIIEDFQILKLCFEKEDDFGVIQRTIVYPDNPPQDFVDPPESGDKLEDEVTKTLGEKTQEWWESLSKIVGILLKICIALLIAVGVYFLLRFIGVLRDAFGRRHPKEDKPRREKRDRRR